MDGSRSTNELEAETVLVKLICVICDLYYDLLFSLKPILFVMSIHTASIELRQAVIIRSRNMARWNDTDTCLVLRLSIGACTLG